MDVGNHIKHYRMIKGYSVNKLANLAGISQSFLRDVELNKKKITVETLSYVCDALQISLADFFNDYFQQESTIDPLIKEIYRLTPQQRSLLQAFLHSLSANETKNSER